jgi:hypothetical protein
MAMGLSISLLPARVTHATCVTSHMCEKIDMVTRV